MNITIRVICAGGICILILAAITLSSGCRPKCTIAQMQVESAAKRISKMDSSSRLAELMPLIEKVQFDDSLEYLNYYVPQARAILVAAGMEFRGTWNVDTKRLQMDLRGIDGLPLRSLTDQETIYVQEWLVRIGEFRVCRIDARPKSQSIKIYVDPSIYFMVMKANASVEYRESIDRWARSGADHRGDICFQVTTNVYVATDRR